MPSPILEIQAVDAAEYERKENDFYTMRYYTILHKPIECPFWKCEIILQGKYYYLEDEGHEYEARFSSAKCPIIENIRLPEHKQDKELSYYPFCRIHPCEALYNFEPLIDVRTSKPPE